MLLLRHVSQRMLVMPCVAISCLLLCSTVDAAALAAAAGDTQRSDRVELILDLKGFSEPVNGLAFSPNGTMLAACGQKQVRIWDVRTGRLLRTLHGQIGPDGYGDCLAVAFSHDSCQLVVGVRSNNGQGALRVYDIRNISEIKELIGGFPTAVTQLAFSRRGRLLAVACEDGKLVIFDWSLRRIVGSLKPAQPSAPALTAICFPLAEPLLLTYGPAGATVLSVPGCQRMSLQRGVPLPLVQWVERLPDVDRPFGGTIDALDLRLGRDTWIASGSSKKNGVNKHWAGCWRHDAPAPSVTYDKHHFRITAVCLSSGCTLAASADERGEVHVWSTKTGEQHFVFRRLGQPVYRAALDIDARRMGFTVKPSVAGQWGRNRYGIIDRVFDFQRRTVYRPSGGEFPSELTSRGGQLSLTYNNGEYSLRFAAARGRYFKYGIASGSMPTCFSLLQSPRLGVDYPAIVGDKAGSLFCCDPIGKTKKRQFLGHASFVTSLSESKDGRFLTSSSTDGTIRIWSLAGDGPNSVEPLLSMLIAGVDDWIVWTPQGYYDASPGCGDLLGWHVNRGPNRSAAFYPVHQFRNQLYRPDIINLVFESGSIGQAVQTASSQAAETGLVVGSPIPLTTDLRQPQTMQRMQPPSVRIISPQDATVTRDGEVHVLAEIVAQNELPIRDVRLLVNGRPGLEKGVSVLSGEQDDQQRTSFSRVVKLLPGENQISVLASNGVASSVPVTVNVKYDAPEKVLNAKPDLYLMSIGISEYKKKHLNLRFAHLDAQKFADSWDRQRGPVYENVSKTLLINEQASAEQIRGSMQKLVGGVTQRDIAVIFISAHGIRDRQLEYYLATHEIDPDDLSGTGLHFSAITQLLEVLPCKVLLFVDTCHAAGITGAKSIWRDPLYELTSEEYGTIVFSSSLSREISVEDEKWGHGAFTKAILETFDNRKSDINGDGFLSLTELEQNVCDRVQDMTKGQQHPVMKRPATIHNIPLYYVGARKET